VARALSLGLLNDFGEPEDIAGKLKVAPPRQS
jgi:hypothetical protein